MSQKAITRLIQWAIVFCLVLASCKGSPPAPLPEDSALAHLFITDEDLGGNIAIFTIDWAVANKLTVHGMDWDKSVLRLYTVDLEDKTVSPLILDGRFARGRYWILSPTGEWGAFATGKVQVIDLKSVTLKTVIPEGHVADWSPDGEQLVVMDISENVATISVYDRAGIKIETLYAIPEVFLEGWLAWSPDGQFIAFSVTHLPQDTTQETQDDVYVISRLDKALLWRTMTPAVDERHPSWSPNSACLVYATVPPEGGTDTTAQLTFVFADNAYQQTVTELQGVSEPAWSPDGTHIAVVGTEGVYTLDVNTLLDENMRAVCLADP